MRGAASIERVRSDLQRAAAHSRNWRLLHSLVCSYGLEYVASELTEHEHQLESVIDVLSDGTLQ